MTKEIISRLHTSQKSQTAYPPGSPATCARQSKRESIYQWIAMVTSSFGHKDRITYFRVVKRLLVGLVQLHALVEFRRKCVAVLSPKLVAVLVDVLLAASNHLVGDLDKQ